MDLKECLAQEYTVDWGNTFDKRTVYIKTPMQFEDFGEEEKLMLLTPDYIRDHMTLHVHHNIIASQY